MPKTTVTKTTSTTTNADGEDQTVEQYRTTVPKGIAEAMDLEGVRLEWSVKSGNTLELRITDE
ncbi:hypothetical protein [Halobaculum sp. EA56]|uniref:hypothetical protein n=1 Tax=Halobaculum sp. EA56 TaxID=3421648 RepID=UPI003EB6DEA0